MEINGSCTRNTRLAKKTPANTKKPFQKKMRKVLRRIYIFTQHKRLEKHSRTCIDMESSLPARPPDKGPRARTKSHQPDRRTRACVLNCTLGQLHGRLDGKTCTTGTRSRNEIDSWDLSSPEERSQNQKPAAQETVHALFLETVIPHTQKPLSNARGLTTKKTINS